MKKEAAPVACDTSLCSRTGGLRSRREFLRELALGAVCAMTMPFLAGRTARAAETGGNKVLIVYFSHSGNTRRLAELIHEQVDWAGETGLRINQNPPSFDQILNLLKHADHDYVVCQYKMIEYAEVTKYIEKMLHDIMEALVELHELDFMNEPTNMGIKSTIESIYDKFDFEVRYLNKRRMMPSEEKGHGGSCGGGHGMGDHHDDDED